MKKHDQEKLTLRSEGETAAAPAIGMGAGDGCGGKDTRVGAGS